MTLTELVQLYAPLAGLLLMSFWLGMLTQRVRTLEAQVEGLKEDGDSSGKSDRLVRLETQMEAVSKSLDSLDRGMQGVQRQIANAIRHPITEFKVGDH